VEQRYVDILASVRSAVTLPVAVKLGPYFSAVGAMARALADAGAAALVLFNRFYQPDIDVASLRLAMDLELSTSAEIRLPLLWIAILHGRVPLSLAASTGVETAEQVFKYLLAGADVVMTTSALLRRGPQHLGVMRDGLARWLADNRFDSVDAIRGLKDASRVADVDAFLRAQYVASLTDYVPGKLVQ
jgi:dihydroorotate dehydrogenase (fumarate)